MVMSLSLETGAIHLRWFSCAGEKWMNFMITGMKIVHWQCIVFCSRERHKTRPHIIFYFFRVDSFGRCILLYKQFHGIMSISCAHLKSIFFVRFAFAFFPSYLMRSELFIVLTCSISMLCSLSLCLCRQSDRQSISYHIPLGDHLCV